MDEHTASLIWDSPSSELPLAAIQILANDSTGAVVVRNISVVLCACENEGTCSNATTPQFNSDGHYRQECECPAYFSGDLCETDEQGCSETSCPESSMCVVNASVPAGFTCSNCQEGYELGEDGKCIGKCVFLYLEHDYRLLFFSPDINECNATNPDYVHNCTQNCSNAEGSYDCLCMDGYELSEDGRGCDGKQNGDCAK